MADHETKKDIYIALMGLTGTGKSTFISHCTGQEVRVGEDLQSCTQIVEVFSFPLTADVTVHLIDTPGFDDTNRSDTDVLRDISTWLSELYTEEIFLSGILYLHRISDLRMQGSGVLSIALLMKLCGEDCFNKVVLVTTMWEQIDETVGERRERELETTKEFWGSMMEHGSLMRRHYNNKQSALDIIGMFVPQDQDAKPETVKLAIQKELAEEDKVLAQTSAGQLLNQGRDKQIEGLERQLQEVQEAMAAAQAKHNTAIHKLLEEQRHKMDRALEDSKQEKEKMQVTMQELIANSEARLHSVFNNYRKVLKAREERRSQAQEVIDEEQKAKHEEQRVKHEELVSQFQERVMQLEAKLESRTSGQPLDGMAPTPTPTAQATQTPVEAPFKPYFYINEVQTLTGRPGGIEHLTFSEDGQQLIFGTGQNEIWIWDRGKDGDWHLTQTLSLGSSTTLIALVAGHNLIFAGARDHSSVYAYQKSSDAGDAGYFEKMSSRSSRPVFVGMLALSGDLLLATDRTTITAYIVDGHLSIKQLGSYRIKDQSGSVYPYFHSMAFAPDGRLAVAARSDLVIGVVDKKSGKMQVQHRLSTFVLCPTSLIWAPNGTYLTVMGNQKLSILTSKNDDEFQTLNMNMPTWAADVCFSPGSSVLLTVGREGGFGAWVRSRVGEQAWVPAEMPHNYVDRTESRVFSMAFHPSGEFIATGEQGMVKIRNFECYA